jgi:hypothetical protein
VYPEGAPLAYKIDHVGIPVADPEAAMRYCREDLGLPVAWELAQYGQARTGGIGLGNLNLEFLDTATIPLTHAGQVALVAFQPAPHAVSDLVSALESRAVRSAGPFTTGGDIFGFTNVFLLEPAVAEMTFFCSYHYPGAHDNAIRRAELDAVQGGHVGLRGVAEVRANLDAATCEALLGPPTDGRWRFDTGPDLVVDASVPVGTARMTWSLHDVARKPTTDLFTVEVTANAADRPVGLAARRAAGFE